MSSDKRPNLKFTTTSDDSLTVYKTKSWAPIIYKIGYESKSVLVTKGLTQMNAVYLLIDRDERDNIKTVYVGKTEKPDNRTKSHKPEYDDYSWSEMFLVFSSADELSSEAIAYMERRLTHNVFTGKRVLCLNKVAPSGKYDFDDFELAEQFCNTAVSILVECGCSFLKQDKLLDNREIDPRYVFYVLDLKGGDVATTLVSPDFSGVTILKGSWLRPDYVRDIYSQNRSSFQECINESNGRSVLVKDVTIENLAAAVHFIKCSQSLDYLVDRNGKKFADVYPEYDSEKQKLKRELGRKKDRQIIPKPIESKPSATLDTFSDEQSNVTDKRFHSGTAPGKATHIYSLIARGGAKAYAVFDDNGVWILKDSKITEVSTSSLDNGGKELVKHLLESKIIGKDYTFNKDCWFVSLNAATIVVARSSVNAQKAWKKI